MYVLEIYQFKNTTMSKLFFLIPPIVYNIKIEPKNKTNRYFLLEEIFAHLAYKFHRLNFDVVIQHMLILIYHLQILNP